MTEYHSSVPVTIMISVWGDLMKYERERLSTWIVKIVLWIRAVFLLEHVCRLTGRGYQPFDHTTLHPSTLPPPLPLAIIEWPTDWAQVRDIILVSFMMKYGISILSCLCQQKSHSFLYFFTCMQYYKIITDHKCASLATRQVRSDALHGPIPSLDISMSNLSTRALILETTIP